MTLRFLSKIFLVCAVLCAATSARAADGFTLSSPDYAEGATLREAQVYAGFGCSGGNQSPALTWDNPPAGTQSFALTLYDPDAPTGSGWWHWVVFDIPADVRALPLDAAGTGALPAGAVQSLTDFARPDSAGPARRRETSPIATSSRCMRWMSPNWGLTPEPCLPW